MKFKDPIFLGNGYFSLASRYQAHHLLEKILDELGGLQQPFMSTERDQNVPSDKEYLDLIKNLLLGLGVEVSNIHCKNYNVETIELCE